MSKFTKVLGRARHVTGKVNVDKAISTADKIICFISLVGAAVSGILLIAACLFIVAYVINRKFIGQVWLFPEEYIGATLVSIAYLSMAYSSRWGAQVNMSIIINKFSSWKKNIIDLLASLAGLVVLGYMTERSIS